MKIANGLGFINDEDVIGKWENIGWSEQSNSFSVENLKQKSGEFDILYFLPNGEPYWVFEGWTKGILLIHEGGSAPILSYRYELQRIHCREYLFLRLENRNEVFMRIDRKQYSPDTIGRHDDINKPFIPDDRVLGKWKSIAFVADPQDFCAEDTMDELYLKLIQFFPNGRLLQTYMDEIWEDHWTKGFVLNQRRITAASYRIETVNGREYLFLEWKMGNYVYGGMKPDFYVFERSDA